MKYRYHELQYRIIHEWFYCPERQQNHLKVSGTGSIAGAGEILINWVQIKKATGIKTSFFQNSFFSFCLNMIEELFTTIFTQFFFKLHLLEPVYFIWLRKESPAPAGSDSAILFSTVTVKKASFNPGPILLIAGSCPNCFCAKSSMKPP